MSFKFNHVFIIDDDIASRFVCEKVIKFLGVTDQLIFFENAEDALLYFSKYSNDIEGIDLIFLDLDMPVMDGFEFIEAIQKQRIYTSKLVIAVLATTSSLTSKVQAIRQQGIPYYISKPLNVEKMKEFCRILQQPDPEKFYFIK